MDYIGSARGEDFETVLVGRKIVDADNSHIMLDDGTRLDFEPGGDCCAYWEVESLKFNGEFRDNIITAVTDSGGDNDYTIHIFAEANEVASVQIDGAMGTGYYGYGINLKVSNPVQELKELIK